MFKNNNGSILHHGTGNRKSLPLAAGKETASLSDNRFMSQAEHLLIDTDFTMGQIAQMIGYTTSSRFAELFKKSTGILLIKYRRMVRER